MKDIRIRQKAELNAIISPIKFVCDQKGNCDCH